jgi:hypothetical protein
MPRACLILAFALACPAFAVEPAAPVVLGASPAAVAGAPKTLADIARERKLGRSGGAFFVANHAAPTPPPTPSSHAKPPEEPPIRLKIERLRAGLKEAQEEYDRISDQVTVTGTGGSIQYNILMGQRTSTLAPYAAQVDRLQRAVDAMPEECRKTPGCMPGWLR